MTKFCLSGPRALSLLLIGASLLGLSACNPTGNGTGPVRLEVNSPNGVTNSATGRVFECLPAGLSASLFFDNGSAADFTQRVTWTSSAPAILQVSNGDVPLPVAADGFYPKGSLIVRGASSTPVTITAAFSGFTDSIDISIGTPTSFTLQVKNPQTTIPGPLAADPAFPDDASKRYIRIAPNSIVDLDLQAVIDGRSVLVDSVTAWTFATPDTTVATIDKASGVVVGAVTVQPAGGKSQVAKPSLPFCTIALPQATINVAPLTGLSLSRQFADTDPLLIGNTESFTVKGDFGAGPEQDLSVQAVFTSSTPAVAAFNGLPGVTNSLSALTAGNVSVSAKFTSAGTDITTPTPLSITVQEGTLTGITMTPTTLSIFANASTINPLDVFGTFTGSFGSLVQRINRRTLFTSDNTAVAQVSNAAQTGGQVVSGGPLANVTTTTPTATITASVTNPANTATPFTATTVVTAADPTP